MVCDSAPPLGPSPQRQRRRKKGRNIHVGRKLPYLEQKLERRKEVRKKVRKIRQKILQVQSEVKKKNIGLSIRRGGDSGFLVYSNTPPTPNQWPFPLIETTPTNNPPSGSERVVMDHGW